MLDSFERKLKHLTFTRKQQQAFLEDVAQLVEDGVPLSQAVETIRDISKGGIHDVAEELLERIAEGKQIADGLEGWFNPTIVEIIRAGEQGGTIAETLKGAANTLAQESGAIGALISAIIYPLAVIILAMIVCVFIKRSVFVNFAAIKAVETWPTNGQTLYYFSAFLESWWWAILISIIVIGFLISRLLKDLTGEVRTYIDKIPLLSLYRLVTSARFMQTLGSLINNGIIFKKALSIIQNRANPYLSWHVSQMQFRLSGGKENIAEVIDTGLISEGDIMRLKVIAKGRGFEHALSRLGRQSAERNAKAIAISGKILGGILLGAGAAFAAFMIFAIYDVGSFVGS